VVGIDAGAGKAEAFDGAAVEEVLLDDLFGVAGFGETVPDGVGIDDEDGPVLARCLRPAALTASLRAPRSFLACLLAQLGRADSSRSLRQTKTWCSKGGIRGLDAGDRERRCDEVGKRRGPMACENGGYGL
jgi:hypothetical protein